MTRTGLTLTLATEKETYDLNLALNCSIQNGVTCFLQAWLESRWSQNKQNIWLVQNIFWPTQMAIIAIKDITVWAKDVFVNTIYNVYRKWTLENLMVRVKRFLVNNINNVYRKWTLRKSEG